MGRQGVYRLLALYFCLNSAANLKLLYEIKFINLKKWLNVNLCYACFTRKDLLNHCSFIVELINVIYVIHHLKRR